MRLGLSCPSVHRRVPSRVGDITKDQTNRVEMPLANRLKCLDFLISDQSRTFLPSHRKLPPCKWQSKQASDGRRGERRRGNEKQKSCEKRARGAERHCLASPHRTLIKLDRTDIQLTVNHLLLHYSAGEDAAPHPSMSPLSHTPGRLTFATLLSQSPESFGKHRPSSLTSVDLVTKVDVS